MATTLETITPFLDRNAPVVDGPVNMVSITRRQFLTLAAIAFKHDEVTLSWFLERTGIPYNEALDLFKEMTGEEY